MQMKIFRQIFSELSSTTNSPNFKSLCNSIPELLNVFEDPAQHVHTIIKHTSQTFKFNIFNVKQYYELPVDMHIVTFVYCIVKVSHLHVVRKFFKVVNS